MPLLLLASTLAAQEVKAPAAVKSTQPAPVDNGVKVPVVPDKNKTDILEIQLRMAQAQNNYTQIQAALKQTTDQFQTDQLALTKAQADACEAAKADCKKDWDLDLQKLVFTAKPKTTDPKK
jgi:hypothetical protein